MLRRSPLKAKRDTPRRNEGRVQHGRMKEKPAKDADHLDWIAKRPCLVCGSPSTVHHVTSDGYKRIERSDHRTVPLCPRHHLIQHGPRESVEALGHAGFTRRHGLDLLAIADRLWLEHKSERGAARRTNNGCSTRSNQPPEQEATDYD